MYFMLSILVLMVAYCLQPCLPCGYRRARYQLLITLKEIFLSPFGRVRFRDFFFADVITSMAEPLKDIGNSIFFISHISDEKNSDQKRMDYANNKALQIFYYVMAFLPFWLRFWQCINKYYYTRNVAHLKNAGKYASKMVPTLALTLGVKSKVDQKNFGIWLFLQLFATFYCLYWDYYMDWGLFRTTEKGRYWLRSKMKFSTGFYYYAMVSNFLFRFFWLSNIVAY